MTMQNLDVHGTFRVRRVGFANRRHINDLSPNNPRQRRSLKADQSARYYVDLITKNPLLRGPGSTASHLFFSGVGPKEGADRQQSGAQSRVGTTACAALAVPNQKRPVRRQ